METIFRERNVGCVGYDNPADPAPSPRDGDALYRNRAERQAGVADL